MLKKLKYLLWEFAANTIFSELYKFLTWHMVGGNLEIMFSINSVYIHITFYPCLSVDTLFLSNYQPNS